MRSSSTLSVNINATVTSRGSRWIIKFHVVSDGALLKIWYSPNRLPHPSPVCFHLNTWWRIHLRLSWFWRPSPTAAFHSCGLRMMNGECAWWTENGRAKFAPLTTRLANWVRKTADLVTTNHFLVACTRLYNILCPSVGPSVGDA